MPTICCHDAAKLQIIIELRYIIDEIIEIFVEKGNEQ